LLASRLEKCLLVAFLLLTKVFSRRAAEFAKLIHHWNPDAAEIEIMDPLDWDSAGRYGKVIDAVREASRGNDVRVYRLTRDATRVEYWVVTREEGRIVGVKALGVES